MGGNAKSGSAAKIKMESFDDLFGGNAAQENGTCLLYTSDAADER